MPDDFAYQAFYCEENVWHLCRHPRLAGVERHAVWIMATAGHCPLWRQRAERGGEEPIFWDYHVLVLARSGEEGVWQVWDLDTTADLPCPVDEYLRLTFPYAGRLPRGFEPRFRLVPGDDFVQLFASDRSHMKNHLGRWQEPPPPWPPIGDGRPNTLDRFRDLEDPIAGRIVTLAQFAQEFA